MWYTGTTRKAWEDVGCDTRVWGVMVQPGKCGRDVVGCGIRLQPQERVRERCCGAWPSYIQYTMAVRKLVGP